MSSRFRIAPNPRGIAAKSDAAKEKTENIPTSGANLPRPPLLSDKKAQKPLGIPNNPLNFVNGAPAKCLRISTKA